MKFYKANARLNGCGCSFGINAAEQTLFISLVKQSAWDDSKKLGQFNGDKINIKSNFTEIGALLDVLQRNVTYSTVHKSANGMTSIKFEPYFIYSKEENGEKTQKGYGLSIYRKTADKELKFLMPFNFAEAVLLKEYFSFAIRQMLHVEMTEARKQYKEKQKQQDGIKKTEENGDID